MFGSKLALENAYNVALLRDAAQRVLPRPVFDYIDGGAEDERTLGANLRAISELRLVHRVAVDRSGINLGTTFCGEKQELPLLLSPVGNSGLLHASGDVAAVQAAEAFGIPMVMSGSSSYTPEEIFAATNRPPWYQLYPWDRREVYGRLTRSVQELGFVGLVVTVDTPVPGNRERDRANHFTYTPKLTYRNGLELARKWRWSLDVLKYRRVAVRLFADDARPRLRQLVGGAVRSAGEVSRSLTRATWDDLEFIRGQWLGPLVVKGIMDPQDARRAVEIGAQGIYVSNHGGRQLDGEAASIAVLPRIVEAVGPYADVAVDGGFRRGSDILKALCLGAKAVGVGRPWAYALAAGGPAGVSHVVGILAGEIARSLELLGVSDVQLLEPRFLDAPLDRER